MMDRPRPFIIAEAGVNHNGSVKRAFQLIEIAHNAQADAVKFQTFRADDVVTPDAPKADYQRSSTERTQSQMEMLKELELPLECYRELKREAEKLGLEFMSTAFDVQSLHFLIGELDIQRLKIPSGEILSPPLVWEIGKSGLETIISTGASNLAEIRSCLGLFAAGMEGIQNPKLEDLASLMADRNILTKLSSKVTLLHCVTEYPAPLSEMNLLALPLLQKEFGLPIGLSDHSLGTLCGPLAVGLGATVLEKHFTSDTSLPGPDHRASLGPEQLKTYVQSSRQASEALGCAEKKPTASELRNRPIIRRSLVAARKISAGETFSKENLAMKRPNQGLSSLSYFDVLGLKASREYQTNESIDPNEIGESTLSNH